jgi:hypothetical protein
MLSLSALSFLLAHFFSFPLNLRETHPVPVEPAPLLPYGPLVIFVHLLTLPLLWTRSSARVGVALLCAAPHVQGMQESR